MNSDLQFSDTAQRLEQGLADWASDGQLSPERAEALAELVQRNWPVSAAPDVRRRRPSRWLVAVAAAVAGLTLLTVATPTGRALAGAAADKLARLINRAATSEKGWAWAEEHQMYQEVLAEATDQGLTFRVHKVLADPTQTVIIYTVEGQNPEYPGWQAGDKPVLTFNGRDFARNWTGKGELINGVVVGSLETSGLPDTGSGTMAIDLRQIGQVQGRWSLSFPVTRAPLTELTRTVDLDIPLQVGEQEFRVTRVQLLPTQTVVHLKYTGSLPLPRPLQAELTVQGQTFNSNGARGHGSGDLFTRWTDDLAVEFDPVPLDAREMTFRITNTMLPLSGTSLRLPLEVGLTAGLEGLPSLQVTTVSANRAVLTYTERLGKLLLPYEEWSVTDDQDQVWRTWVEYNGTDTSSTLTLTVPDLPAGRKLVAAEARHVWQTVDQPLEVTIPLE